MAGQVNETEKLPWLEPYREPAAAKRRPTPARAATARPAAAVEASAPTRRGVPLAAWLFAAVAIVGAAAGGGYWAGHRNAPDAAAPAPTVTIPVARVDPIPMPEVDAPAAASAQPASAPRTAARRMPRDASSAVRRSRAPSAPPRPDAAPPMPKVMAIRFSPPPSAGRPGTVVDLGRYLSPSLADSAYRATVGRYPYLGGLTKVVAPQPVVYGQPRLYALQLGAKSPTEARQLCTNLKRIGRPCAVR